MRKKRVGFYMSDTGAKVVLDGSNSYDPDGTIVSYYWLQKTGASVILSEEKKWKEFLIIMYFFTHLLTRLFCKVKLTIGNLNQYLI